MVKNIIFDIDGTLWDTCSIITKAWNKVFNNEKLPHKFTDEELGHCMGMTINEIYDLYFANIPCNKGKEVMNTCFKEQDILLNSIGGKVYDGVKDTIEKLSSRYNLYIVSNCYEEYLKALIKKAEISSYIKGYLCAGQTKKEKGETLKILIKENNLEDCVYVGDTQRDYIACKVAGIPFIWAEYGFGKTETYKAKIKTFKELLNIIDTL